MNEFMYLFRGGDARIADATPEAKQAHMQKWMTWMQELAQQGKLVGAEPLETSGRTVAGTSKVMSDGPYVEGKEMVGGYLICKAADYDEAVTISLGCPILEFDDGVVEIRAIQKISM